MDPYYISTPIYYVNDRPHIGHCYTTLVADVAARMHRLIGRDVFFLTGTDEHAEKVVLAAKAHGMSPQEWADLNAARFKEAFSDLNFSNDDFVRTTEDRHKDRAAEYIRLLIESGDIELGDYEGWYDPSQEEYVTENTARESGYKSPVTGRPLERRTEKNYFFKLGRYTDRLIEAIEKGDKGEEGGMRILPEARRNEVLSRIRGGLQPVPISRRIREGEADWGIRMPGDQEHRIYVWIEALCNYLTVVDTPERRKYWPADVHLMAKDILWFHAVIWPAMLMALGEKLPRCVYAHGYFVSEGMKMSKSLDNFIEIDLLKAYCDRFHRDAVRWYLATQGPLGSTDADFAYQRFVEVYNADLANGIGNAVSRVSNMIEKYFEGKVPQGVPDFHPAAAPGFSLEASAVRAMHNYERTSDRVYLDVLLRRGTQLSARVDAFIGLTRPFALAKEIEKGTHPNPTAGRRDLAAILYDCAEALRIATFLLYPAMPEKMAQVWRDWNCSPLEDPHDCNSAFKAPLEELARWGGDWSLKTGQKIAKGEALFMRADPKEPPPEAGGVDSPR